MLASFVFGWRISAFQVMAIAPWLFNLLAGIVGKKYIYFTKYRGAAPRMVGHFHSLLPFRELPANDLTKLPPGIFDSSTNLELM